MVCVMQPSSITRCSSAHHRDFRAVLHANRNFSTAGNPVSHATSSTNVWLIGAPSLLSPSFVLGASVDANTGCATEDCRVRQLGLLPPPKGLRSTSFVPDCPPPAPVTPC